VKIAGFSINCGYTKQNFRSDRASCPPPPSALCTRAFYIRRGEEISGSVSVFLATDTEDDRRQRSFPRHEYLDVIIIIIIIISSSSSSGGITYNDAADSRMHNVMHVCAIPAWILVTTSYLYTCNNVCRSGKLLRGTRVYSVGQKARPLFYGL